MNDEEMIKKIHHFSTVLFYMRFEVFTTFHGMQGHPSPAEVLSF
jgi:hypothetical protein